MIRNLTANIFDCKDGMTIAIISIIHAPAFYPAHWLAKDIWQV